MMNTVKVKLQEIVRKSAARSVAIRKEIHDLAWTPGSEEDVRRILSERNSDGQRLNGKKALAPFRRPETGQDRYCLWNEKRAEGCTARMALLALWMLRGRPYSAIEPKVAKGNEPSTWGIWSVLKQAGAEVDKKLIQAWLEGGAAPVVTKEAA